MIKLIECKEHGYTMDNNQLFKVALRIAELDLNNIDDDKKQIGGLSKSLLMDTKFDTVNNFIPALEIKI